MKVRGRDCRVINLSSTLPAASLSRKNRKVECLLAKGGPEIVIHFSCDRCKRPIDPHDDLRYAVRIEVRAKLGVEDGLDEEDDRDHLMEIHEILESEEASADDMVGEDVYQQRRFDLCPECYRKFARNPVGRERNVELNFSQN